LAEHLNLYVGGDWRPALDGARREIRCPADGQLVAIAAEASTTAGLAEGAVLRCGGSRPDDPLTVETFTDEHDAVRIANDTDYGVAGAVWTQDAGKAQRVAHRLRHGTVWINDYHPYVPQAECGGMKRSGNGRELGRAGLDEYREIKHIWQNTNPRPERWFRG
jgi:betaine-aldehyde dehydrogenase